LDRTPAADVIAGTAQAWCEAIETGATFDEALDRPRFRRAFVTLAQTCDRWPSPKQFITALESIKRDQRALPPARDPDDPYERQHQQRLREYGKAAAAGADQ